jgi:hypothetical protein
LVKRNESRNSGNEKLMNDVVDKGKEVVELNYNEGSINVAKSPT